jgi:hypothetical protein
MYFLGLILVGLEVLLTVWLVLLVITGNWGGNWRIDCLLHFSLCILVPI